MRLPTSQWREPGTRKQRTSARSKRTDGLRVWRAARPNRVEATATSNYTLTPASSPPRQLLITSRRMRRSNSVLSSASCIRCRTCWRLAQKQRRDLQRRGHSGASVVETLFGRRCLRSRPDRRTHDGGENSALRIVTSLPTGQREPSDPSSTPGALASIRSSFQTSSPG